jgi:hypothetical protein
MDRRIDAGAETEGSFTLHDARRNLSRQPFAISAPVSTEVSRSCGALPQAVATDARHFIQKISWKLSCWADASNLKSLFPGGATPGREQDAYLVRKT